jgi:hypothetical protein
MNWKRGLVRTAIVATIVVGVIGYARWQIEVQQQLLEIPDARIIHRLPDARVISRAPIPTQPSFSRLYVTEALCAVMTLVVVSGTTWWIVAGFRKR